MNAGTRPAYTYPQHAITSERVKYYPDVSAKMLAEDPGNADALREMNMMRGVMTPSSRS